MLQFLRMTRADTKRTYELISHDEAHTIELGRRLGSLLRPGDLVLLFAPFGAGKTHLTKGIASAWGVDPHDVNSPSFVLINEYESDRLHRRAPIHHIDLYRIESPDELATVGLDDAIDDEGLAIIEWAERAEGWLSLDHLAVRIEHIGETDRRIVVEPHGDRYAAIIDALSRATDDGLPATNDERRASNPARAISDAR